ncbi:MAG TPA: 3-hydroxyacyl-CoA dehydrogenase NAD-binding domain-containing protein, partial [Aggregatilineaceae bacterium]|nr:3-hydroxyacyl-CoA dehydrogenase NAD-binding domain-containing protein [Aggregatilineaceae bacterium]
MDVSDIRRIGVIGAGTMGHGIAQVCALHGYQVMLVDVDREALDRGLSNIMRSIEKLYSKDRITETEYRAGLDNIRTSVDLAAVNDADVVIEAAKEDPSVKADIFS